MKSAPIFKNQTKLSFLMKLIVKAGSGDPVMVQGYNYYIGSYGCVIYVVL